MAGDQTNVCYVACHRVHGMVVDWLVKRHSFFSNQTLSFSDMILYVWMTFVVTNRTHETKPLLSLPWDAIWYQPAAEHVVDAGDMADAHFELLWEYHDITPLRIVR
jgi:hypothetical protein